MLSLTRLQRYGIAVLGVVLVAALRLALDSILREDLPLFFFIIPIILAGWCGGLWPGVLATALSVLVGDYLKFADRFEVAEEVPRTVEAGIVIVLTVEQKIVRPGALAVR